MSAAIGLDIGSSSIKGAVVTDTGEVLAARSRAIVPMVTAPGRFELDPLEHADLVLDLVTELAGESSRPVTALSAAAASGNTVLLGRGGRPLTPIVGWMDRRAAGRDEEILGPISPREIYGVVGWPYLGLFPLAHLAWFRHHMPRVLGGAERVAMNNDYVAWRLCGEWALDPSTATTFYLQNQTSAGWHKPYLDFLGIDESMLSKLGPTGSVVGAVRPEVAARCGLSNDAVMVRGCFDHPAAARACGVGKPGEVLLSCGTSWVALAPLVDRSAAIGAGFLVDPFTTPDGRWAGMLSLPEVGRFIDDLTDRCYRPGSGQGRYDHFTASIEETPPARAGALPRLEEMRAGFAREIEREAEPQGAASPEAAAPWRTARSGIAESERARRLVEVLAMELRSRLETIERMTGTISRVVMVGGPAANRTVARVVSEVLGRSIAVGPGSYAGAIGAALVAAAGHDGALPGIGDRLATVDPDTDATRRYDEVYERYRWTSSSTRDNDHASSVEST